MASFDMYEHVFWAHAHEQCMHIVCSGMCLVWSHSASGHLQHWQTMRSSLVIARLHLYPSYGWEDFVHASFRSFISSSFHWQTISDESDHDEYRGAGPSLVVLPEISYFRDSTIQNSLIRESLITRSLAIIHNIICVTAQYYVLTTTLQFKEDVDEWSIVISTRSCRQAFVPKPQEVAGVWEVLRASGDHHQFQY